MNGDSVQVSRDDRAISTAHLVVAALPRHLVDQLEEGKNGRDAISKLAESQHTHLSAITKPN